MGPRLGVKRRCQTLFSRRLAALQAIFWSIGPSIHPSVRLCSFWRFHAPAHTVATYTTVYMAFLNIKNRSKSRLNSNQIADAALCLRGRWTAIESKMALGVTLKQLKAPKFQSVSYYG